MTPELAVKKFPLAKGSDGEATAVAEPSGVLLKEGKPRILNRNRKRCQRHRVSLDHHSSTTPAPKRPPSVRRLPPLLRGNGRPVGSPIKFFTASGEGRWSEGSR